jgi:hypothetical protein
MGEPVTNRDTAGSMWTAQAEHLNSGFMSLNHRQSKKPNQILNCSF